MGHPILSLLKSQWKLRQQYDHNFPMEGKQFGEQILASKEINKSKRVGM